MNQSQVHQNPNPENPQTLTPTNLVKTSSPGATLKAAYASARNQRLIKLYVPERHELLSVFPLTMQFTYTMQFTFTCNVKNKSNN